MNPSNGGKPWKTHWQRIGKPILVETHWKTHWKNIPSSPAHHFGAIPGHRCHARDRTFTMQKSAAVNDGFLWIYMDLYGFIWIYRCFSRKYGHGLIASHIWTSVLFQASAFSTPNVISRECPRVLHSTRTVIWLQTICPALDGEVIHCQILKTDWYHW